jgi:hypothetical protein
MHSLKQLFLKGITMVLDTPQKIEAFRLRSLRQGLKLEMKGMRLTAKGKTCYAILKGMGYKGTKQQVFDAVTIDSENALAEAINS